MINRKFNIVQNLLKQNIQNDKEKRYLIKKLMEKKHFGSIDNTEDLQNLEILIKHEKNLISRTQFIEAMKKMKGKSAEETISNVLSYLFVEDFKIQLKWSSIRKLEIFKLIREIFSISEKDFAAKASQHIRTARHHVSLVLIFLVRSL